MNFENKNVLAPMVRVTTLPMRLMALRYGADYVYSEEIVDFKIIRSKRVENDILGTIDFVMDDGIIAFRTCKEEKSRVIFQMGTANPERALLASKIIEKDVAAIDINMGCPKGYSTKGGMGAALLKKPELACSILRTLSSNLDIPVTCKIRIFPNENDTLELVKKLASTGVKAIAVHGRYKDERPQHPVHDDIIKLISKEVKNVVILANGGSKDFIKTFDDISYFKQCCGVSSVMIGRAAMWNPCVFKDYSSPNAVVPCTDDLIKEYLKLAILYDNHLASTKYCVTQLLHDNTESEGFRETIEAAHLVDISAVWSLSEFYQREQDRRAECKKVAHDGAPQRKKPKLNDASKHVHSKCSFVRRLIDKSGWSPKLALIQYCVKMKWNPPSFELEEDTDNRLFFCTIYLNDNVYTNEIGNKNKRLSEQAVSCICLADLGLIPEELVEKGLAIEMM